MLGPTYTSRTLQNYKDSLWGRGEITRMIGVSQRDRAYQRTDESRKDDFYVLAITGLLAVNS